ncbi:MAG: phosphopyruvate hydratase [Candidatus Nomurabacteria bacterium]|nr:phosphopyruvate hydratase [Candidatus Nomurabacteria bacterium]
MSKIDKIFAIETKDSRGKPTISVTVTSGKASGTFSVPSGASTGKHEACELRDPDGGVKKAIYNINKVIAPALVGKSVFSQKLLDHIMIKLDGTPQKKNLGGNAMIGVSIAIAKTAADVHNTEVYRYLRKLTKIKSSRIVPLVYMNLINGGKHAHNDLAFQEYHIVPMTSDVKQAIQIGLKIQDSIEDMIARDLQIDEIDIGDEGGFAPKLPNVRKPLEYLQHAINEHPLGCEVRLALDVAASSFYEEGKGILGSGKYLVDGRKISKEELTDIYRNLIKEFNILSIEDPYDEEAFEDFRKLKNESKIHIVGDDLTVTNIDLVEKAQKRDSINTMIIKPNQIGTLSETLDTMKYARENGIDLIVSHRSGETDDDFIADLAYAFGCFGIKAGSPRKHERMIKYKRLIQISQK